MHICIMDGDNIARDMDNSDIKITLAACLLMGGTLIWFHESTKRWHYQIIAATEVVAV